VKQELFAASMHLAAARASIAPVDPQTATHLMHAQRSTQRAHAELTAVMDDQTPPLLAGNDLAAALAALAEDFQAQTGIALMLDLPERLALPPDAGQAIYRVSQEAVSNILRHARAGSARLAIAVTGEGLSLTVTDNGVGIAASQPEGGGLAGIRERVARLGGTTTLRSDGYGKCLRVTLPGEARPVPPGRPAGRRVPGA